MQHTSIVTHCSQFSSLPQLSMAYMESQAYQETYGGDKVWQRYRRNYAKGQTYRRNRRTCIEVMCGWWNMT